MLVSPFLFNLYMDELSNQLNMCEIGCLYGNLIVNHLMYADDLVIFCSYSAGMQKMLKICTKYGVEYDIKYNAIKSHMMIVRSVDDKNAIFPDFKLCDNILKICSEAKYLGHMFTDNAMDDDDIMRQRRKLYARGNMLVRKFHMCSPDVKVALLRAYCTPLYTAHLWYNFKKGSMQRLTVAYNDAMRMLLRVPRYFSASQMFAEVNVPACQAVIRNLTHKFMVRLDKSENCIINVLINPAISSTRYTSPLWKHWYKSLHTIYT